MMGGPVSTRVIPSNDQPPTKLAASAKGKLVDVGEDEDVIDVPTGAAPITTPIERIFRLVAFGERRLVIQRLLPGVVHVELEATREALFQRCLQVIVTIVKLIRTR